MHERLKVDHCKLVVVRCYSAYMQTWLLYAILGGIFANAVTFINRHALRGDHDPTAYAWWFEVLRTVVFIFLLPLGYAFQTSPKAFLTLTALGIVEVAAVYTFMQMFSHTQLSVSILVSRLRLIFAPLLAVFFLGEILNPKNYLGITLIFIGAIIAANVKTLKLDKGIKHSLLFAVYAGVLSNLMKVSAGIADTPVVMIAMGLPSIFILPLLMKSPLQRIKTSIKLRYKHNSLSTIFNVASMYLYVEALRIGHVGLVFSAFNSMAVIAILAGILFLGEKDNVPQKIIGTTLSIAGIFFLT